MFQCNFIWVGVSVLVFLCYSFATVNIVVLNAANSHNRECVLSYYSHQIYFMSKRYSRHVGPTHTTHDMLPTLAFLKRQCRATCRADIIADTQTCRRHVVCRVVWGVQPTRHDTDISN